MLVLDELWRSTEAIYTGDPVLSGDDVVVSGSDGALHALDASTGEPRWSVPSDDGPIAAASSPRWWTGWWSRWSTRRAPRPRG